MMKEIIVDHVPDADSTEQSTGHMNTGGDNVSHLSSSSSNFTHNEDDTIPDETKPNAKTKDFVAKEDSAVLTVRSVIFSLLVLSTIGMSLGVYFFLRTGERRSFERVFEDQATKLLDAIGRRLDRSVGVMDSHATSLASFSAATNMTWPFVTIPDSEIRLSKARMQSRALVIQQLHVVPNTLRNLYEGFTFVDSDWVEDTVELQQDDTTIEGSWLRLEAESEALQFVSWDGSSPESDSQVVATWQSYPLFEDFQSYNVDLSSHPILGRAIKWALQDQQVVLSEAMNLDTATVDSGFLETNYDDPVSSLLLPVQQEDSLAAFDKLWDDGVALIQLSFLWASLLEDILQEGETGMIVVLENTCGQTFSFQIDGSQATYLGPVDSHDQVFEDMEINYEISELLRRESESLLSDSVLADEFCAHMIRVFPSKDMKSEFFTAIPWILAVATLLIFVFTSAVFGLYDMLVSIRQEKVLTKGKAEHSASLDCLHWILT